MEADGVPDWCPNAAMDYEVTNLIVAISARDDCDLTDPCV